jgi:hypothetical protein
VKDFSQYLQTNQSSSNVNLKGRLSHEMQDVFSPPKLNRKLSENVRKSSVNPDSPKNDHGTFKTAAKLGLMPINLTSFSA